MMPNGKSDTNNLGAMSTDNIGMNYDYPEASYAQREEIVRDHLVYQQGLMWTLANHPRVPESIRREMAGWGLAKDEFVEQRPLAVSVVHPRSAAIGRRIRDDRARLSSRARRSPTRSAWAATTWTRTIRSATSRPRATRRTKATFRSRPAVRI